MAQNSSASSNNQALIFATTGRDGDGNDDDFQSPCQAVAFSQSVVLSSLKASQYQPRKPSNTFLSKKMPKFSAASGKENGIMINNQTSNSRVSKDGQEKHSARKKRKDQLPVCLGKRDIPASYVDKNEIVKLNLNLSVSGVSKFDDDFLFEDGEFAKGAQCLSFVDSSLSKDGAIAFSNCCNACADSNEFDANSKCFRHLEMTEVTWETTTTLECIGRNASEEGDAFLALAEMISTPGCQRKNMEGRTGAHFNDWITTDDKIESSSDDCPLESKNKSFLYNSQYCSSEIDCSKVLRLKKQFKDHNLHGKAPIEGTQIVSSASCQADSVLLDGRKEKHNAMSIEAKLLASKCLTNKSCAEAINCEEFDAGTQLNTLMDLCSETGELGDSERMRYEQFNLGTELIPLERNLVVQCPLCANDITNLSEEMRHIHTNVCLDNYEINEVSAHIGKTKPSACQQVIDTNPVLDWLRALELCQYEEVFIREEIDWNALQWLTEEDLINIGVVALGPRKKIVHALNELWQKNGRNGENLTSNSASKDTKSLSGNKLITDFFNGQFACKVRGNDSYKPFANVEKSNKGSIHKSFGTKRSANNRIKREVPPWCCISGTPFRVDAFRYSRGDCSHWFLTHFHMDHYQGLTKSFSYGKIYCSKITAHLVNIKIGVSWDRIQILPLNEKITIAGVNLTCLDANHCPGSIIILFEPSNDKTVLHTGDFRFSAEMAGSNVLQSSPINTLILDTTYCNPKYDFPKQDEVIQFVIDAIQAEDFNPKTLFLIGSYTIGKERLFVEVARTLKRKVYVGAEKMHMLQCLNLPVQDFQMLTTDEMESQIHVVPLWTIASFKRMKHISNQYSDRYSLIVAFSPTGWTSGKGKKKTPGRRWQQGTIIRYEVPYSEHCSFTELREFVRFISPKTIIPSVNNEGPQSVNAMLAHLLSDS